MGRGARLAVAAGVAGAALLAILGSLEDREPPKPAPVVPAHRLPVLGTVGDLPPEEERFVIEADARGGLFLDGARVNREALREALKFRADAERLPSGILPVKVGVVLRVDRDVPWPVARFLLMSCADPQVRAYRVFFAALPEGGGEEGAIATFLPGADVDTGSYPSPVPLPVEIDGGGDPGLLLRRDLYRDLRWEVGRDEGKGEVPLQARLVPSTDAPTGRLLEAADLCLRAGIRSFVFADTSREEMADLSIDPLRSGIRIGGAPVEAAPDRTETLDPLPRVVGRYAGQFRPPPSAGPVRFPLPDSSGPVSKGHSGPPYAAPFSARRREWTDSAVDDAVKAALDWLALHQSPLGAWDCDGFEAMCKERKCGGAGALPYDVGVSGLATLAFLAAGETHKTPRHGSTVRTALKYLKGIQDADGCFGPRVERGEFLDCVESGGYTPPNKFTYGHAIATLAMVEAYGITRSPLFKASAQNGVNFAQACRNPYLAWRYGFRPMDNDTSVTGWMVMALRVAKEAGLEVDAAAFEGAIEWLDKAMDAGTGRTGYTARDNGPARAQELLDRFPPELSESMTAEAVFARILCGTKADDRYVLKGADLCGRTPPRWNGAAGSVDFVYWHFGSLALYQVGGERWTAWSGKVEAALVGSQHKTALDCRRGSWDPEDPWGAEGGRVYATAINALTLETPRRYTKFGPAR